MLKRKILLTGCAIVLALSGQEAKAAEACTAVPSCAELGYTRTDCKHFVSLKCPFDKSKLFCGSDGCETGYYRYSDTECIRGTQQVIYSDGKAIGVAVSNNLAVAMTDENPMEWAMAITKCKAKTTGGKSWRLPTMSELSAMAQTYSSTCATLELNGGYKMTASSTYWSSTEISSDEAWGIYVNIGERSAYTQKFYNNRVRCVFNF